MLKLLSRLWDIASTVNTSVHTLLLAAYLRDDIMIEWDRDNCCYISSPGVFGLLLNAAVFVTVL